MDGLNQQALELSEPEESLELVEEEIVGRPSFSYDFYSVKKKKGAKSIAYKVNMNVIYEIRYEYYASEEDGENGFTTHDLVSCSVPFGTDFYYEKTKDKSVKFLGAN